MAAVWTCGWTGPVACRLGSVESVGVRAVSAVAEWPWVEAAADVDEVVEASAVVAVAAATVASCLAVAVADGVAAADGSVLPDAVSELVDDVVPACAVAEVLVVVFGATGVVAATVPVNVTSEVARGAVGVACWPAGVATVFPAVAVFAFAVVSAVVAVAVASAAAAAAASESALVCVDDAVEAAAAELAAMAAAAIASGAVALPEVVAGVGAGVPVSATGTGIATAMAFMVIGVDAFCCVDAAASVEESVPELSLDDDLMFDFPLSVLEGPDVEEAGGGPSALEFELALEGCPLLASWLFELLLAGGWLAACEPLLLLLLLCGGGGVLSLGRCHTDCASEAEPSLLAETVLLSTSDAKMSFPCDGSGSDRADFGGAP
jgi:hypothetical protein